MHTPVVHGPGVGRINAVPVLHRPRARSRSTRHRGTTKGIRRISGFSDESSRAKIPDPQSESTFAASHLKWGEHVLPKHARSLALYRQLLALRRDHAALRGSDAPSGQAFAQDDESVVVRRSDAGETFWVVARFKTAGEVDLGSARGIFGDDLSDASSKPFSTPSTGNSRRSAGDRCFVGIRERQRPLRPARCDHSEGAMSDSKFRRPDVRTGVDLPAAGSWRVSA